MSRMLGISVRVLSEVVDNCLSEGLCSVVRVLSRDLSEDRREHAVAIPGDVLHHPAVWAYHLGHGGQVSLELCIHIPTTRLLISCGINDKQSMQ